MNGTHGDEQYVLELRAEVIRTISSANEMRKGQSDLLEIGTGWKAPDIEECAQETLEYFLANGTHEQKVMIQAMMESEEGRAFLATMAPSHKGHDSTSIDIVQGTETVTVDGTLKETVGRERTNLASSHTTTVHGSMSLECHTDNVLMTGTLNETHHGGEFLTAVMSDNLIGGLGVRTTAPADMWLTGLTGIEEKLATANNDVLMMDVYAVGMEREYGTSIHNMAVASIGGAVYTTTATGFLQLHQVQRGLRNAVPSSNAKSNDSNSNNSNSSSNSSGQSSSTPPANNPPPKRTDALKSDVFKKFSVMVARRRHRTMGRLDKAVKGAKKTGKMRRAAEAIQAKNLARVAEATAETQSNIAEVVENLRVSADALEEGKALDESSAIVDEAVAQVGEALEESLRRALNPDAEDLAHTEDLSEAASPSAWDVSGYRPSSPSNPDAALSPNALNNAADGAVDGADGAVDGMRGDAAADAENAAPPPASTAIDPVSFDDAVARLQSPGGEAADSVLDNARQMVADGQDPRAYIAQELDGLRRVPAEQGAADKLQEALANLNEVAEQHQLSAPSGLDLPPPTPGSSTMASARDLPGSSSMALGSPPGGTSISADMGASRHSLLDGIDDNVIIHHLENHEFDAGAVVPGSANAEVGGGANYRLATSSGDEVSVIPGSNPPPVLESPSPQMNRNGASWASDPAGTAGMDDGGSFSGANKGADMDGGSGIGSTDTSLSEGGESSWLSSPVGNEPDGASASSTGTPRPTFDYPENGGFLDRLTQIEQRRIAMYEGDPKLANSHDLLLRAEASAHNYSEIVLAEALHLYADKVPAGSLEIPPPPGSVAARGGLLQLQDELLRVGEAEAAAHVGEAIRQLDFDINSMLDNHLNTAEHFANNPGAAIPTAPNSGTPPDVIGSSSYADISFSSTPPDAGEPPSSYADISFSNPAPDADASPNTASGPDASPTTASSPDASPSAASGDDAATSTKKKRRFWPFDFWPFNRNRGSRTRHEDIYGPAPVRPDPGISDAGDYDEIPALLESDGSSRIQAADIDYEPDWIDDDLDIFRIVVKGDRPPDGWAVKVSDQTLKYVEQGTIIINVYDEANNLLDFKDYQLVTDSRPARPMTDFDAVMAGIKERKLLEQASSRQQAVVDWARLGDSSQAGARAMEQAEVDAIIQGVPGGSTSTPPAPGRSNWDRLPLPDELTLDSHISGAPGDPVADAMAEIHALTPEDVGTPRGNVGTVKANMEEIDPAQLRASQQDTSPAPSGTQANGAGAGNYDDPQSDLLFTFADHSDNGSHWSSQPAQNIHASLSGTGSDAPLRKLDLPPPLPARPEGHSGGTAGGRQASNAASRGAVSNHGLHASDEVTAVLPGMRRRTGTEQLPHTRNRVIGFLLEVGEVHIDANRGAVMLNDWDTDRVLRLGLDEQDEGWRRIGGLRKHLHNLPTYELTEFDVRLVQMMAWNAPLANNPAARSRIGESFLKWFRGLVRKVYSLDGAAEATESLGHLQEAGRAENLNGPQNGALQGESWV